MPELPEVETTRRGLAPAVEQRRIERAVVRHRGMRQPVPRGLERRLAGARIACAVTPRQVPAVRLRTGGR